MASHVVSCVPGMQETGLHHRHGGRASTGSCPCPTSSLHQPRCDCRGPRGAAAACPGGPCPWEQPTPWLRLREARALARRLPGTPTILGGLTPPQLLVRQHHDVACQRRVALPRIPQPEHPDSAPVRSPQHHRDRWPPCGATHASIPRE